MHSLDVFNENQPRNEDHIEIIVETMREIHEDCAIIKGECFKLRLI